MPIPKKIVLFRERTQCYPVDVEGKVWHIWGGPWGPLCEITFEHLSEDLDKGEDEPFLVMQDHPDYFGMGPTEHGYHQWWDHRTKSPWDSVASEYDGLNFLAKRFGLDLESPRHRVVAVLLDDLVKEGILVADEQTVTDLIDRWLTKILDTEA